MASADEETCADSVAKDLALVGVMILPRGADCAKAKRARDLCETLFLRTDSFIPPDTPRGTQAYLVTSLAKLAPLVCVASGSEVKAAVLAARLEATAEWN